MAYTGGELNHLNGKYGISASYKSVPVMKLIKVHTPKSKDELYELIKFHYENKCECGIKSQGTIEMFGKNLYNAQISEWGTYKYSLKDCIQWEYDLFVVQSLKGSLIENNAIQKLSNELLSLGYCISEAGGFVDEELRVDIIISKEGIEICGIQVKPHTFNMMRSGILNFNKTANLKWGKPVFYLFYDKNENFINFNAVIDDIKNITI